jgi:hypothetical protein
MVVEANELLRQAGLSPLTRTILSFCATLDEWGAWTWSLKSVALISLTLLFGVRLFLKKKRGVDWYAFLHALVTGTGGLACVYLDIFASESLTGTPEPLRSFQCQGPLTSLHRILPAITMGYALFDLIDGLTLSIDFALHGAATLAIFAYFCGIGAAHVIAPFEIMEVSTIFLSMIRADFFPAALTAVNMGCFALCFFLFRILVVPYLWVKLIVVFWNKQNCFHGSFFGFTIVFGVFFNLLDLYWFVKIVKKIRRKILGQEDIKGKNDLTEQDDEDDVDDGETKKNS